MRHIRETIVATGKQEVLHILGVFVALDTQYATRMRHIVIHGMSASTKFFHIIS